MQYNRISAFRLSLANPWLCSWRFPSASGSTDLGLWTAAPISLLQLLPPRGFLLRKVNEIKRFLL